MLYSSSHCMIYVLDLIHRHLHAMCVSQTVSRSLRELPEFRLSRAASEAPALERNESQRLWKGLQRMDAVTWPRKEHQRTALRSQNLWERLEEASTQEATMTLVTLDHLYIYIDVQRGHILICMLISTIRYYTIRVFYGVITAVTAQASGE